MAIVSGALLALSFPKFGAGSLGWAALVPLLVALFRQRLSRAFLLGLTTGAVYFAGTLYWITRVMVVYGGLQPVVAMLVNLALIAYLALYPALFAAITARLTLAAGPRMLMAAPLVWVATELGRTRLFTGFPWVLLGYSQADVLPVAQLASVLGVYGVSALVVLVSAGLAVLLVTSTHRHRPDYAPLIVALAVTALVAGWGTVRIRQGTLTSEGESLRVGLIQGNVEQDDKWDERRAPQIFREYLDRTRQAADEGASFVLWPESATPFVFAENLGNGDAVRSVARDRHLTILLGSDEIAHGSPNRYYNSAYLVDPHGRTGGVYRKIHLVPFGEYVPLRRVFFFASRLVEAVSDFTPGTAAVLLPVKDHLISTAICYEVVYPNLVRESVLGGSELLTTITNDAWFGPTSAPYQHFAQASMRAIENGRYLVRAANTGISGIVDPYGRVLARSALFEPATIVGDVRLVKASTIYTRTGDLFPYGCTLTTLLLLVGARRRSYRMKPGIQRT